MKKNLPLSVKSALLFVACFIAAQSFAQVTLDTFVGGNSIPADDEPICDFPIWPEVTSDLDGPFEGTLVHDFKLYTLENDSVQLSQVLNDRKPVLLIGCNYTCFVYRGKADKIHDLQTEFGDDIHIYLVYTVEAHPVIDVSPYFGVETVGAENYADGILYRQPTTYGERKEMVSTMLDNMDINVPVLIDGPCNAWWLNYGTAPNCAFLIDPDGKVYDAQNWFNKPPEDMYASVEAMLDTVATGAYDATGTFTSVKDETDETLYGVAGNIIAAHFNITNSSDDDVLLDFMKEDVSVPAGWLTFMCTDLCYSPDVDSTTIYILPGATESVRVDFYTDDIPASGSLKVVLRNRNDAANTDTYTIFAQSIEDVAIDEVHGNAPLAVYPNPATMNSEVTIQYDKAGTAYWRIMDMHGAVLQSGILFENDDRINIAQIAAGNYFLQVTNGKESNIASLIILNK